MTIIIISVIILMASNICFILSHQRDKLIIKSLESEIIETNASANGCMLNETEVKRLQKLGIDLILVEKGFGDHSDLGYYDLAKNISFYPKLIKK